MARKSASSSVVNTNGHPLTPETTEDAQESFISGTNDQTAPAESDAESPRYDRRRALAYDPSLLPNGSRSLSSISLQAFSLGLVLACCTLATLYLAWNQHSLWRLPVFFAALSLFHFLEFWTTAHFNVPAARASSFLLFSNGVAYNIAHSLATLEILVSSLVPWYQQRFVNPFTIVVGISLVIVGQVVRTTAMAHAGTNFNHTPAKTKLEGHVLVTSGIYSILRHPSYFGFFWWAFGTQVLVGNKICLVGYLIALWKFFSDRIQGEEITLIDFFGTDYEAYRKRTGTGIPFIR